MQVYLRMRNASDESRHKGFSFMGVPSKCWYMKTLEPEDKWRLSYGTILTIETSRWVPQGTQVQLFVVDRDGNPFIKGCQRHRNRNGRDEAFVFRDPYNPAKIYPMTVSKCLLR